MGAACIVGVQWGDEGKGKVIDLLARQAEFVVRWAGGSNAGHTIHLPDGRKFVLHLLPGGVFRRGVVNVVGTGVVVDPGQLLAEIDALAAAGQPVGPENLRVSARAHLVLPWHRALDAGREAAAGGSAIGTTGRGIGPCYEDKAARRGLRLLDLARPARLGERLAPLARERNLLLREYGREPIDPGRVEAELAGLAPRLLPFLADTGALLRAALAQGREILFEGAQGVLLDLDHGTYPYVTSSSASAGGAPAGTGVPCYAIDRIYGVAKAYATRVGEGPFPTELLGPEGERLRRAGAEFGATTGRPRRCGWFDAVAARYAVEVSGVRELVLTKLDVLTGLGPVRIAGRYEGGGGFPAGAEELAAVRPVLEEHSGWEQPLRGATRFADLPAAARGFVARIEELVGVPVRFVSLGPGREEVVER